MDLSFTPLALRPEWVSILADWFETEWPDHFSERSATEHFERELNRDSIPIALVAVAKGTPIGVVSLRDSGPLEGVGPWLGGLYVHPEIRGYGVGTALVRVAATLCWQLQQPEMYVATTLEGYFEGLGFEAVDGGGLAILRLTKPETFYDRLGGDDGVRALVDRFYDLMDAKNEARELRDMHARSLSVSRDKLYKFLSGWMGGPGLYVAEYGHPRLRARHLPFSIGTAARDQWMLCMNAALEEVVRDAGLRNELSQSFTQIADHMRNREGE